MEIFFGERVMKSTLVAGFSHTHTFIISEEKTVPYLYPESPDFASMPKVFATGFMVGLIEWACIEALSPHLDEGEGSLGIHIDVSHSAPTPPGMAVTVKVKCVEVDGRQVTFEVSAEDEMELIGEGRHKRFIVDWDHFNENMEKKISGG
jgi:fluoroacetyl-CoA thioesterase